QETTGPRAVVLTNSSISSSIDKDPSSTNIIISDSEHSSVTYTSVPSPVEDYLDIGSPEVDGPPSPDYEPEQAPPSPIYLPYVPELVYPEYMPPEDDVFPAEEQPLPVAATPTADSPGYILEFDPKGDPEEDDEEDPEEDPVDYPADSTVVALPAVDHVPSEEVTEPLPQIPSPPLTIPSPPPNSPTHIEIPESCLPLQKRLRFASPTPSQEVRESSAADAARHDEPAVARDDPYSLVREELYGFVDRVDVAVGRLMSKELDYAITDTWDELETTIMYGIMEDAQDDRMAREAWGLSMNASDNAHSDVMSLRTTLVAQHALILDLQAADRRRQGVIKELLAADHKRQVQLTKALRLLKGLQTQMMKFHRHHGPAKGPAQPDAPGEADCIDLLFCLAIQYRSFVQGVTAALATRDANRNGNDSHTSGTGRPVQVAHESTSLDFLKCKPLNFKGTKGVVGLSQWFEKMESVYSIRNCTVACQVKFATCTLQGNALTWWNSHVKTTTPKAAHALPWRTLKKMMTDKYCPWGEFKKLEFEMWNLKVKGTDVVAYSQRFQELALMCDRMFPEEIDKVERYVGGLPDTIHGSVMATKPKTMQDAIEFSTELMDKKINTWAHESIRKA
nr:hypothetical protein [Tanacetum cinerariifolium]